MTTSTQVSSKTLCGYIVNYNYYISLSMNIIFSGNCALFTKYEMVYIANFENIENANVKIFIINETNFVYLQDINLQNLPENIQNPKKPTEVSKMLLFEVL